MIPRYWVPTFADAVTKAFKYFKAGQYEDAKIEYQIAAAISPPDSLQQTKALEAAWIALSRSLGEMSELDPARPKEMSS
jgi:hypothetical protein